MRSQSPQGQNRGDWGRYRNEGEHGSSNQGRSRQDYPDERIKEAVCERLSEDPSIDVSEVSVDVKDGCVTFQGTVPERRMRHTIEDLADSCWGVKEVENQVRVKPFQIGEEPGAGHKFTTSGSRGGTKGTESSISKNKGKEEGH